VRGSRGTRFNADRLTFGGNFNANGTLNTAGETAVADYVYQYEVGLKNRGSLGGAHYTLELTGYYSHFNITTYELNPVVCDALGYANGACPVSDKYKTLGVELYATLRYHGFSMIANMTANHAQQNPSTLGEWVKAHGIPDLSYSFATNYDITDKFAIGADIAGVTKELQSYPSTIEWPGSAVVSANIKFRPVRNLELGISAYNLFNALALQGAGNAVVTTSGNSFVGAATSVPGRSTLAHVKFTF
jgi:outer membrane receptor protein involved in Fe transport